MKVTLQALDTLLETNVPIDTTGVRPTELDDLLKTIDINLLDDFDSNGWQFDFWCPFKYKNANLCYRGSWFEGTSEIINTDYESEHESE